MTVSELPLLDEHSVEIAAPAINVWTALLETLDESFSGRIGTIYARLVGCEEPAASGPRPLAGGSTITGFRVTSSVPERELVLEGRHRFSSYRLTFRLEDAGAGFSRLSAESRAIFPGSHGRLYRLLVVSSGGHVVAVRRMLASVRRRAETRT